MTNKKPLLGGSGAEVNTAHNLPAKQQTTHPGVLLLSWLRKTNARTWFRNLTPQPGRGHRSNVSRKGADLHSWDLAALEADNRAGASIYFITGEAAQATGKSVAVQDSDVTSCPALFAEWDDRPIEWQLQAWQELGLPEPSAMVTTGGKSVHCYWVLREPMDPAEWRVLQSRLIDYCGSDPQCKNPSRLMRLPGFEYIDKKTGKGTGNFAELVQTGEGIYTPAEIEACLPAPAAAAQKEQWEPRPEAELIAALGRVPVFHHDEGRREELLGLTQRLIMEWGLDRAHQWMAQHSPTIKDLAGYFKKAPTGIKAGSIWPWLNEHYGVDLKRGTGSATADQLIRNHDQVAHSTKQKTKPKPSGLDRFTPQPDSTANWGQRHMGHSRAMVCFDRCVVVQAQRERNSLRRRARLLKAAKDLGLAAYINRDEIAQRVLEAKAQCSGEGFKLLSAADRAAMPKPVVRWLLPGVVPLNDMSIIGGRPKVGKTRIAVAMVAAVLRGEPFLDNPAPTEARTVLLVTDDQSDGDSADMLTAMSIWDHPALHWSRNFRLTENDLQALLDGIKANPGALVVLDSLRSIGRALQKGENDPEIGATLYDLKQAVLDAGGTLLLIHHCNKAADLVGLEALSGHNAIGGAANTILTLHYCPTAKGYPDKNNPQRRLFREGRSGVGFDLVVDRAGAGAFRLVSTFDHWEQQLAEAKKRNRLDAITDMQQRVLDALEEAPDSWMTRRQVCEAIGVEWTERGKKGDPRKVGDALYRLKDLGEVESKRAGVESKFHFIGCTQNEAVTYETTGPLSDTNASQCPDISAPIPGHRDTSPMSRTAGDTETHCPDLLAPLSRMSRPTDDLVIIWSIGDSVEHNGAAGCSNGWKVAAVEETTRGTRYRITSGAESLNVAADQIRPCAEVA